MNSIKGYLAAVILIIAVGMFLPGCDSNTDISAGDSRLPAENIPGEPYYIVNLSSSHYFENEIAYRDPPVVPIDFAILDQTGSPMQNESITVTTDNGVFTSPYEGVAVNTTTDVDGAVHCSVGNFETGEMTISVLTRNTNVGLSLIVKILDTPGVFSITPERAYLNGTDGDSVQLDILLLDEAEAPITNTKVNLAIYDYSTGTESTTHLVTPAVVYTDSTGRASARFNGSPTTVSGTTEDILIYAILGEELPADYRGTLVSDYIYTGEWLDAYNIGTLAMVHMVDKYVNNIDISALESTLNADGEDTTELVLMATGIAGDPVPDGTEISVGVNIGNVYPSVVTTVAGAATATLQSANEVTDTGEVVVYAYSPESGYTVPELQAPKLTYLMGELGRIALYTNSWDGIVNSSLQQESELTTIEVNLYIYLFDEWGNPYDEATTILVNRSPDIGYFDGGGEIDITNGHGTLVYNLEQEYAVYQETYPTPIQIIAEEPFSGLSGSIVLQYQEDIRLERVFAETPTCVLGDTIDVTVESVPTPVTTQVWAWGPSFDYIIASQESATGVCEIHFPTYFTPGTYTMDTIKFIDQYNKYHWYENIEGTMLYSKVYYPQAEFSGGTIKFSPRIYSTEVPIPWVIVEIP